MLAIRNKPLHLISTIHFNESPSEQKHTLAT